MGFGDLIDQTLSESGQALEDKPPEGSAQEIADLICLELSKPKPMNRMRTYHASGVKGMCAREAAWMRLFHRNGAIWRKQVADRMQVTFDIGSAVHEFVQEYYLKNIPGWKHMGLSEFGVQRNFGTNTTLAGSIDDLLENEDTGEIIGVEIKTMKVKQYVSLTKPPINHRWQCFMYMWLWDGYLGEKKYENLNRVMTLYVPKEWVKEEEGPPLKAFFVEKDKEYDKATGWTECQFLDIAKWEDGVMRNHFEYSMLQRACKDENCGRARSCFFNPVCFGSLNIAQLMVLTKDKVQQLAEEGNLWVADLPFLGWT